MSVYPRKKKAIPILNWQKQSAKKKAIYKLTGEEMDIISVAKSPLVLLKNKEGNLKIIHRQYLTINEEEEEKPLTKPSEKLFAETTGGKEEYFLLFNKEEIFKNLIATEGHFRNVLEQREKVESGAFNCVVKHLADAESHGDEAISHSLIVEGSEASKNFEQLRDGIRELRRKTQDGHINSLSGLKETRKLRRMFESFNPSFDISKCKSCDVLERKFEKELKQHS